MRSRMNLGWVGLAALGMAAAAATGAGCGSDAAEPGGDASNTSPSGGTPPANGPTYYEDVAPILMENCASCHRAGGIASFPLLTYEQAKTAAGAIRSTTEQRIMPPFNLDNSGSCNTFHEARWLADEDIATIAAWVEAGTPEGDPANAPEVPPAPTGLDRVDATFDMGLSYTPDESLDDDYRCFIVDAGITADQFLVGAEVKPGEEKVVHHVILYALDTPEAEADAAAQDAADEAPGYQCFGGAGVNGARWLVGWAPGEGALQFPEGTGLPVRAGRKAVMQVHYNLSNGPMPDRSVVDVKLAPSVEKEAEISIVPALNLYLPPGEEHVEASDQYTIPDNYPEITLWGIAPHMHTAGKTMRVEIDRAGEDICLGQVDAWDFHWQGFSHYTTPLTMKPGDTLKITCGYDTRGRTEVTTWGEGTSDEMCIAFFYITY